MTGRLIHRILSSFSHQSISGNQWCNNRAVLHNTKTLGTKCFIPYQIKFYCSIPTEDNDFDDTSLLEDEEYTHHVRSICGIPDAGHQLFVIHPYVKWGKFKNKLSPADLRLQETCALVETLPKWNIVDKAIYPVKRIDPQYIFGKGTFKIVTSLIKQNRQITAVLVGTDLLNSIQLATLQRIWRVPVYDRYAIVLQIFKEHSRTKVSKIQIALAEIPFLRNRLSCIQLGQHDIQLDVAKYLGGLGETYTAKRRLLLQEREVKLKNALVKIKSQRHLLRKHRLKKKIPTVAVVGYTNAGKTSLIKAITGDRRLQPKDMLFATLDVTAHAGYLPNHMMVLFMDTVGFISDIPTNLIDAFSATLEDALIADVIVHIRDVSHPDTVSQKHNVLETLSSMLPGDKFSTIIEVCNKIDLKTSKNVSIENIEDTDTTFPISATTGKGLSELIQKLQEELIVSTGQMCKRFKVPVNGPHLSWLYKEATVQTVEPIVNSEYFIVSALMTDSVYARFKSQFSKYNQDSVGN